ncbi:TetR/AcrR family transcriptional regulator [Paenibacillus sp. NPDC058071]|uniref:TetR/AcrR family transcriptional regulator n=1 Tax=Paenibacillus sp. NPDC058071 TaxID=3346326 RepID=UPI0036D9E4CD
MPKIVDHDLRREQLAEAAWRVIRREGLEGISVRRVAEEAGMSLGSLRHYFTTQAELLAFSMQLVSERVNKRIDGLAWGTDLLGNAELLLTQFLPLDEERLAEAEVWLAFMSRAYFDQSANALGRKVHGELRYAFDSIITRIVESGLAADGIDPELESKRLHAFIDGLALHGATRAEKLDAEQSLRAVRYHLNSLLKLK